MSFLVDKVVYKGLTFDQIMLIPYHSVISPCCIEPFYWFKLQMERNSLVELKAVNARKEEFIVNKLDIHLVNAMNRTIKKFSIYKI